MSMRPRTGEPLARKKTMFSKSKRLKTCLPLLPLMLIEGMTGISRSYNVW